jgi:hypothetical protein
LRVVPFAIAIQTERASSLPITAPLFGIDSVTESAAKLPPIREFDMPMLSAKYRAKALAAELSAKTAPDHATKVAWTEIAIEWHALATKTAVGFAEDLQIS